MQCINKFATYAVGISKAIYMHNTHFADANLYMIYLSPQGPIKRNYCFGLVSHNDWP
jgi:hypothetical protein